MYSSTTTGASQAVLNAFKLDGMMMRYSHFMPRLYNYCLSLGMTAGKIMPSRAFCSDESQGFPVILIAKQFGAFPFNHGRVGGIVSTGRHGPHASHGDDLMIIQASHVGYEPETRKFGIYRRIQTRDYHHSSNCGKISGTLKWYLNEYQFACQNIFLEPSVNGRHQISINNLLLDEKRDEGLLLDLEQIIAFDKTGKVQLIHSLSTARCFNASAQLIEQVGEQWPKQDRLAMEQLSSAAGLIPELFRFKRNFSEVHNEVEGSEHLEKHLLTAMPWIVTHPAPALAAAQILTQVEFDRAYRTIANEPGYKHRNLLFISGLNIDISPRKQQIFPLTKFVPWAAYVQKSDGSHFILEQKELFDTLMTFDIHNNNEIDLEKEIQVMEDTKEVQISYDFLKT